MANNAEELEDQNSRYCVRTSLTSRSKKQSGWPSNGDPSFKSLRVCHNFYQDLFFSEIN
jgi:hypothetical protein